MNRLRVLWQVLRGRSVIYRVTFAGDIHIVETRNALITENRIIRSVG